jgi:acetolactate decarboxylase
VKVINLLYLFVLGISLYANDLWDKKVYSFGNLTEVLKYKGVGDTISLQNLKPYSSIYGVGLLDKLQGEIQIFDSTPHIASINQSGLLSIENGFKYNASFLVYANVPQWVSISVPSTIYNKQQFIEYLEDTAKENGISTFKEFPFILEGTIKANNYRIFSYQNNDMISQYSGTCACDLNEKQHDLKKSRHRSLTLQDTMLHTPIKIIGFYSPKRGIITDQYSYSYMNFITKNKKLAGHIQKMMLGEEMVLKLPKVE